MAEVDTSSYLKPQLPAQKSAMEQLGQYQGLEANKIGIDRAKLELTNKHFDIVNNALGALADDPDLNSTKVVDRAQYLQKLGLMTPDHFAEFVSRIPGKSQLAQDPDAVRKYINSTRDLALQRMEALRWYAGDNPRLENMGNGVQPVTNRQGQVAATGPVVPTGLPPGTPGFNQQTGREQPIGANQPQSPGLPVAGSAPGASPSVQAPTVTPAQSRLPVAPPMPQPRPSDAPGQSFDGRFGASGTTAGGPPPMFEEGKKQLALDQEVATSRLTAIKPAVQALDLMDQLQHSGPGTAKFTQIVAAMKNAGIIPIQTKNDQTAITQEIIKKLNQYVSSSGAAQRSDASQTLKEASSPNPNVQILPALKKLTEDQIALDRIEAARPGAFSDEKGTQRIDMHNYGQHRSTFPASMDERAFILDRMSPEDRQQLISDMSKKLESKNPTDRFNAKKFFKSLKVVDKQGLIDIGNK